MKIKAKFLPIKLSGEPPKSGTQAPDFTLEDQHGKTVQLTNLLDKPVVISVIPSIKTHVCSIQTRQFNQLLAQHPEVHFLTISNNSKEDQENWCAAEGLELTLLHDEALTFGKSYGLYMPLLKHLARSVFLINQQGTIVYEEIVPDVSHEPDYQQLIQAVEKL